jgi:S1-C subfamily serine protease
VFYHHRKRAGAVYTRAIAHTPFASRYANRHPLSSFLLAFSLMGGLCLLAGCEPGTAVKVLVVTATPSASSTPTAMVTRPISSRAHGRTKPLSRPTPLLQSTFFRLYQQEASGVLRIVASTCGGTGIGSGFLLPSGMVATVAHVVSGAVSVAIMGNGETTAATIVGYDSTRDLALLQPSNPWLATPSPGPHMSRP